MRSSLCRLVCLLLTASTILRSQPVPQASSPEATPASRPATTIILAKQKGSSVLDLVPADIEVREDGLDAAIQEVHKLGRGPIQYCILFDSSNSERDQLRLQQKEAYALLNTLLSGSDRGRLYEFDASVRETSESTNPTEFVPLIANTRPGGATSLFDAVVACARRMLNDSRNTDLRVMFLFSDGDDNQSQIDGSEVVPWVLRAGIRVYSFNPSLGMAMRGRGMQEKLARLTGGEAYSVSIGSDMDGVLSKLKKSLENQFAVTYAATPPDGKDRILAFSIKSRKKGLSISAPETCYKPAH